MSNSLSIHDVTSIRIKSRELARANGDPFFCQVVTITDTNGAEFKVQCFMDDDAAIAEVE